MSTPTPKIEVLWSPNREDEFATYGNELKLYSFQEQAPPTESLTTPLSPTDLPLSTSCHGHLIGNLNSDVHCMPHLQGVAWQRNERQPYYFAVGQGSGKVLLANLGLDQSSLISSMNQVLTPRNGRPCTCLSWNPNEPKLLAEGLEKSRNESSLIVWDVTRTSADSNSSTAASRLNSLRSLAGVSSPSSDSARYFEVGLGEHTTSLAWLPKHSSCLVAGIGKMYLRLYDIRGERDRLSTPGHSPREVANHKAISGICIDPLSPQTLATHAESGSVYLWDIRFFTRPVYSFTRSGNIVRLSWMPTRPGCLSMITNASPYLRIIDIPSYTFSQDQMELSDMYTEHFTQRVADRCPYYQTEGKQHSKLTGLSWHPKWENICLLATAEGVVKKLDVFDKVSLSWSPQQQVVYCGPGSLKEASEEPFAGQEEDISMKMRRRVKEGYGFDAEKNTKLVREDLHLHEVWKWLQLHQDLSSKGMLSQDKGTRILPGVCSVLGADKPMIDNTLPSHQFKRLSWNERSTSPPAEHPHFPVFTSSERKMALQLCGWSFTSDKQTHGLEDYLKREEMAGHYERAAAIAVFQGNIRRGIASLKDGASVAKLRGDSSKSTQLNLIALALSGYTPQEKKLWHETCAGIKSQISQPYLKAAFVFLCSSGRDAFTDVLACEMSLQDCVGVACTYLDDVQLHTYITRLTAEVVDKGLIHGLFLTGLTDSGIQLLTNFVNQTGDVQTASLVAGQVMTFAIKHKVVQAWFQGLALCSIPILLLVSIPLSRYRDLLDVWRLWQERALFDGQRKKLDSTFKPPRQAFIMCSYCSKSIASEALRHDRRSAYHSSAEQRTPTSCPNCRKPLPRCSLCLLNMVASASKQGQAQDTVGSKVSTDQFGQWFTWCQSCRHGGHAHHISEWFSHHNECPVMGCTCNCFSLDSIL